MSMVVRRLKGSNPFDQGRNWWKIERVWTVRRIRQVQMLFGVAGYQRLLLVAWSYQYVSQAWLEITAMCLPMPLIQRERSACVGCDWFSGIYDYSTSAATFADAVRMSARKFFMRWQNPERLKVILRRLAMKVVTLLMSGIIWSLFCCYLAPSSLSWLYKLGVDFGFALDVCGGELTRTANIT